MALPVLDEGGGGLFWMWSMMICIGGRFPSNTGAPVTSQYPTAPSA